jgi:hypothetical protein
MFAIDIRDTEITVTFRGTARLLAMRKRVEVPLTSIADARLAPEAAAWMARNIKVKKAWRGSYVHGRYAMGSLTKNDERSFWAIRSGEGAIELSLVAHDFDRVVLEPDDPNGFLDQVRARLGDDS